MPLKSNLRGNPRQTINVVFSPGALLHFITYIMFSLPDPAILSGVQGAEVTNIISPRTQNEAFN